MIPEGKIFKIFNLLRKIEKEIINKPDHDDDLILVYLDEIDGLLEYLELKDIKYSYIETIQLSIDEVMQEL